MNDINWNAVHAFWLIAEHRSFALAARAIPRTSVQALRKRVRTLENEQNLNLRLLGSRGTKDVELTEAGRQVFRLVAPLFRDFERLIAELRGEDSGALQLAATAFSSNNYVAEILAAFSPHFPDVSIHLHLQHPAEVIRLVESGSVDFGICAPPKALVNCEVRASVPLRLEVILPRGHRLRKGIPSWRELLREPLILPERGSMVRKAFEDLLERRNLAGEVRLAAEMTTRELSAQAVRAGLGIALAVVGPGPVQRLPGVVSLPPPPGLPAVKLALLSRKDRYLSKYMRRFAAVTAAVFRRRTQSADGYSESRLSSTLRTEGKHQKVMDRKVRLPVDWGDCITQVTEDFPSHENTRKN